MAVPSTITKILGALVSLVGSWEPNTSIENDIQDGVMLLGTASSLGAQVGVGQALANDLMKADAFVTDLEAGQIAIGPTVSFNGKKVASFYAYEDSPVLASLMGANAPPTS